MAISVKHADAPSNLVKEVGHWIHAERENRELNSRVATALGEVRTFLEERRSDLERRKGKMLQTSGFKEETRAMEAALAGIRELLASGRNISRIFSEIDKFLATYHVGDTLCRLHTSTQLADAREDFMCAFHDSIRGTRLADLLDILYLMPFACWRSRGLVQRNFRSPTAAEIQSLLKALERQGLEVNRVDIVLLAAIIRIQLGITPRIDYHSLSGNKLAELLTDGTNLARHTAKALPFTEAHFRTASSILANLRRWETELLGNSGVKVPTATEAEMLQIVFLAGDAIRINGTEIERSVEYLWLLATVCACGRATLKDVLALPYVHNARHPIVAERLRGVKSGLDTIAVLADENLVARWSEARVALNSLNARSETIAAKANPEYGEYKELEQLRDQRSEVGKTLIKCAESLHLLEPALLDMLVASGSPAEPQIISNHLRTLGPAKLMERNRACSVETRKVARQELEKLRGLIGRMAEVSRQGFAASSGNESRKRMEAAAKPTRKTSDGVDVGTLSTAELRAAMVGSLRKAVGSVRDARSKVEGARRRTLKSDLLSALNVFQEKIKKAAGLCDTIDAAGAGEALDPSAAETVVPLLREIMAAQTSFSTKVNSAKMTPAEKLPFTTVAFAVKSRLSDDLRDIEALRAELLERAAEADAASAGDAAEPTVKQEGTGSRAEAPPPPGNDAPEATDSPARQMARLAAAANSALKPVKELVAGLDATISDEERETQVVLTVARELMRGASQAREVMAGKFASIESIAAADPPLSVEYVEKFDRWQHQLAVVEEEAGSLLRVTEHLAGIELAVRMATALEEGLYDPGASAVGAGDETERRISRSVRCADALKRISGSLRAVQNARGVCTGAAGSKWRLLKGAAAYLQRAEAELDVGEAELKRRRSRIEELQASFSP